MTPAAAPTDVPTPANADGVTLLNEWIKPEAVLSFDPPLSLDE